MFSLCNGKERLVDCGFSEHYRVAKVSTQIVGPRGEFPWLTSIPLQLNVMKDTRNAM